MKQQLPKVIVIVGPTASGKTGLGITIAKAVNGEIISADSMQIYNKLNIGTAKATLEEQRDVKHHLIDICDIEEKYSVKEYKEMCYQKISEIYMAGKVPVIVGGTGLYINAVVNNMNFKDEKEDIDKNKYISYLNDICEKNGNEYLYSMLEEADPLAARNIHPNNVKRVIRALVMAKFEERKTNILNEQSLWGKNESIYDFFVIYIDIPRDLLYEKINKRVDIMINDGIVSEARYIKEKNLDKSCTAMQAIGYKELFDYLDKNKTLEECVESLKKSTRHYAKRQITWFDKLDKDYIYHGTKEELDYLINNINDIIYKK